MFRSLYEEALKKVFKNPDAFEVKGSLQAFVVIPRLPEDSQINWNETAEIISRLVRASSAPYNGAYSFLNGEKIIIWKASVLSTGKNFWPFRVML